jgi:hypothetical protein
MFRFTSLVPPVAKFPQALRSRISQHWTHPPSSLGLLVGTSLFLKTSAECLHERSVREHPLCQKAVIRSRFHYLAPEIDACWLLRAEQASSIQQYASALIRGRCQSSSAVRRQEQHAWFDRAH